MDYTILELNNELLTYTFFYVCCDTGQPSHGLYFYLRGVIILPGESIDINDIGNDTGPRNSRLTDLVCDTTNINIHCCRRRDNNYEQPLGNWLYPNNSMVVKNNEDSISNDIFVRIGYLRQVRLVKRGNVNGPLGKYTCEVPDMNGTIHRASIYITSSKGDSIIHSSN